MLCMLSHVLLRTLFHAVLMCPLPTFPCFSPFSPSVESPPWLSPHARPGGNEGDARYGAT